MGAGKSTVGAHVADLTARPFVDLDRSIERRHGPISELFSSGSTLFEAQRSACEIVMSRKSSHASDSSSFSFFLAAFSSPEEEAIFWIASSVRM